MKKLKLYLLINSIFSGVSGLIMMVFSNTLMSIFEITNPFVFPVIGVNLLAFSFFVGYVVMAHLQNSFLIRLISLLDGLWVSGSLVIVFFGLFDLSTTGYIFISIIAVWVGFLAYKQNKYLMDY